MRLPHHLDTDTGRDYSAHEFHRTFALRAGWRPATIRPDTARRHILPLPPVSTRFGAPMGRRSADFAEFDPAMRLSLQRVPLDRGGYDRGGAYWGIGEPLYQCTDDGCGRAFFRAKDRAAAKLHVMENLPGAQFLR